MVHTEASKTHYGALCGAHEQTDRSNFLIGLSRVMTVFHKISRFSSFQTNSTKLVILSSNPPFCLPFPDRV